MAVLPENGCDIVEVIDRSTGVDVMVRTPWGFGRRPGHGPDVARALSRAVLGRLAGAAAERRRRDGAARRRVGVPRRGGHHRVAGRRARRRHRAPVGVAHDRSARDRARDPRARPGARGRRARPQRRRRVDRRDVGPPPRVRGAADRARLHDLDGRAHVHRGRPRAWRRARARRDLEPGRTHASRPAGRSTSR